MCGSESPPSCRAPLLKDVLLHQNRNKHLKYYHERTHKRRKRQKPKWHQFVFVYFMSQGCAQASRSFCIQVIGLHQVYASR